MNPSTKDLLQAVESALSDKVIILPNNKNIVLTAEQVQSLTSTDVETRLLRFLKEQYGSRKEIRINLSKKDVAAAIGTTPETLSRLLLRLKKEGILIWEGRMVRRLEDGKAERQNDRT